MASSWRFGRASLIAVVALLPSFARAGDAPATQQLYEEKCMACHMADGNAAVKEMNLADGEWKHGTKLSDMIKVITSGVEGTAMQPFKDQLSKDEIEALARYVRAFDKSLKPEPEAKKKK
jgi:mono/diheme cytochrome c family protein